jgi:hypothetical protein
METSDAQREGGKTTFEDSYMIGTHLMVYNDDDKICIYLLHLLFFTKLSVAQDIRVAIESKDEVIGRNVE